MSDDSTSSSGGGAGALAAAAVHGTVAATGVDASPPPRWRRELAEAVRDLDELWHLLDLPAVPSDQDREAARRFDLLVPRPFLARMQRGDREDPLLLQVLPQGRELLPVAGFDPDPLAEAICEAGPGLLQKYHGRALLVASPACAVHCRYCFRRHYPYQEVDRRGPWWRPALAQLAADPDCDELILSGGDPLLLGDGILSHVLADAAAVPSLRRLRVHSRLPVVMPSRISEGLVKALCGTRLQVVMVIHANHPAEIDAGLSAACRHLQAAGIVVLNQSVLLAGVNDDAAVLQLLSQRLIAAGVLPYYLHRMDKVEGAAAFAVPDHIAAGVLAQLHARLPGYLLPRWVAEEPGALGKTVLAWSGTVHQGGRDDRPEKGV